MGEAGCSSKPRGVWPPDDVLIPGASKLQSFFQSWWETVGRTGRQIRKQERATLWTGPGKEG